MLTFLHITPPPTVQIYQLIDYIVNIDYDIFRPANLENWEASLQLFAQKLETIEHDGKNIIDKCIPKLRLTEMGIELINNAKNLNTRKCLAEHMITKHDSIVQKFISEIEMVEQEFRQKVRLFSPFCFLAPGTCVLCVCEMVLLIVYSQ